MEISLYMVLIKVLLFIILIIFSVGIIKLIRNRQKYNSYKVAFIYTFIGLVIILFSAIVNSLESGRWDKDYIMAFLSIIYTDSEITYPLGFFLRRFAIIGYLFLLWGLLNLFIVRINRKKT